MGSANATVPYKSWHCWWVFIILLLLISHAFLAHLAKWSHPCNHWQVLSFWQWLLPLPTLPSPNSASSDIWWAELVGSAKLTASCLLQVALIKTSRNSRTMAWWLAERESKGDMGRAAIEWRRLVMKGEGTKERSVKFEGLYHLGIVILECSRKGAGSYCFFSASWHQILWALWRL